jgi:hypothetical protein
MLSNHACYPAQGFRSDLLRKRKNDVENRISLNSNTSSPAWIRIFKANTSTSHHTQAAPMAYVIPAPCINKSNNTALDLRATTTAWRRLKLNIYMNNINVPPRFTVMAGNYKDELTDNISLVCDGGIDYDVPQLPPQSMVSRSMCRYLIYLFDCHLLFRRIILSLGMFWKFIISYMLRRHHYIISWVCRFSPMEVPPLP